MLMWREISHRLLVHFHMGNNKYYTARTTVIAYQHCEGEDSAAFLNNEIKQVIEKETVDCYFQGTLTAHL